MKLYDAIHSRRTVHRYNSTPLADGVLERLLAAAHQAPNHKLTWPWRFTVVGQKTREAKLLPLGIRLKTRPGAVPSPKLAEKIAEKLLNPAGLIVVSVMRCDDAFRAREDYAAACCAIQNIQLAATAEGLGSKWSSGGLTTHIETYAALGIDRATEDIIGFIWIGEAECVPIIERPPFEPLVRTLP